MGPDIKQLRLSRFFDSATKQTKSTCRKSKTTSGFPKKYYTKNGFFEKKN